MRIALSCSNPALDGLFVSAQFNPVISDPNTPRQPAALVFWIIWFAILQGLVMIQFVVGAGIPQGADQGTPPPWYVGVAGGLAVAALAIRFFLIPKLDSVSKKLPAMIVGLALSEAVGFAGIFLIGKEFPSTRLQLFGLAVACVMSFAPVYANGNSRKRL
jgi:hypothetical protein